MQFYTINQNKIKKVLRFMGINMKCIIFDMLYIPFYL